MTGRNLSGWRSRTAAARGLKALAPSTTGRLRSAARSPDRGEPKPLTNRPDCAPRRRGRSRASLAPGARSHAPAQQRATILSPRYPAVNRRPARRPPRRDVRKPVGTVRAPARPSPLARPWSGRPLIPRRRSAAAVGVWSENAGTRASLRGSGCAPLAPIFIHPPRAEGRCDTARHTARIRADPGPAPVRSRARPR